MPQKRTEVRTVPIYPVETLRTISKTYKAACFMIVIMRIKQNSSKGLYSI